MHWTYSPLETCKDWIKKTYPCGTTAFIRQHSQREQKSKKEKIQELAYGGTRRKNLPESRIFKDSLRPVPPHHPPASLEINREKPSSASYPRQSMEGGAQISGLNTQKHRRRTIGRSQGGSMGYWIPGHHQGGTMGY